MVDEALINRAAALLIFLDEHKAAAQLVENGVTPESAFLAVKAATILCRDKE